MQVDTATFTIDLSAVTTGNGFYNLTVQAAEVKDIYGINGLTGKQITWTQFLTVPSVQAFLGIPAGNLAAAYDTIDVLFNLPIDVASVTPARFSIYKEGVLVAGNVVIDSVRADHKLFYLSGLGSILTQNGVYEFRVDLPNIKSETQEPGVQPQSINLTVDNVGPLLMTLEKSTTGGLDPQQVTFIKMKFNEEVFGFNTASIVLTKNGEVLPLNIAQLSNTDLKNWMAGNFGLLTYGDGNYTFTVKLTGLKDATGNSGIGLQQITWIVNRSSLVNISNLKITPDLGYSNSDKVTSGQTLNVAFDLDANASQVTISQVDLSGENVLATVTDVASGNVSLPFTLATGGNTGIKVTATGTNGGVGIAQQPLFIDQLPLTAKWNFAPNQTLASQVDNIILSFSNRLLIETALLNAIQLKRNGEIIPTGKLSFEKINDTAFTIKGISKAGFVAGNYQLIVNLQPFNKYVSGIGGAGQASVSWIVQSANHAPVAHAGTDFTITTPGTYSLNGSLSSDPDNDQITYQWTAPAGVELTNANTATPSFNITTASQGNTYLFLLLVSDGSLFTTDVVDVTVNLQTTPVSFTGLSAVYCSNALPATLTGIPAGGVFSGPGISGNVFDPSVAGGGTHSIKYSKDGLNFEQSTTVKTAVIPVFTSIAPICYGAAAPLLPASSVNGISGTWSPEVVINTATGSYLFTPTAGQCATTVTLTVTVNPLPEVTLAPFTALCNTDAIVTLTGGTPTGGIYSGQAVLNGQFNPSIAGVGSFPVTYTFTNSDGCTAKASQSVSVTDCNIPCTATASADGPVSFCEGGKVTLTASSGTSYIWSTGAVTQSVQINSSGNYTVQVTTGNCRATSSPIKVTVNPLPVTPVISASCATSFCVGGNVTLSTGKAASYLWSNGATTQSIKVTTGGNYTVTVKNSYGCSATSAIIKIIVNDCTTTYCPANGTRPSKGFIQKVATYRGINNNSGWDGGYGNYLNLIILNRLNGAFGIAIKPGYKEANFINPTLFTRVWIDWNQDGDFTDAGELVFAPCKASNLQRKVWIHIPSTAKLGSTRMRIALRADKAPSSCGTFTFGEVEDYTISLVTLRQPDSNKGNPSDYIDEEEPGVDFSVYPNPASTNIIIERSGYNEDKASSTMVSMQLIDVNGRILMEQRLINLIQAFDVSKVANGIYFVNIKTTNSTTVKKIVIQH